MKEAISIDSTPFAAKHLPFANEVEMQRFVEEHAEQIFGLKVISSTRRGEGGLFKIDVLAIDDANTPFIFECKWNQVSFGAIRQLVRYRKTLLDDWPLFEERVSEMRGKKVTVKRREPVLVAIGYRYTPSVLIYAEAQEVVCVSYSYHPITLTVDALEQQRSGKVSFQQATSILTPASVHPSVSKKHIANERFKPLPKALQKTFWELDSRLCKLEAVTAVYGKNPDASYRVPNGKFAEARIDRKSKSIHWSYGLSGKDSEQGRVEMLAGSDADKLFELLSQAHQDAE